jgi:hypothetical protein
MGYDRRPVVDLLRGPLLHTPQGWVVLASGILYGLVALAGAYLGVSPSIAQSPGAFFAICVSWPLITFLFYVRSSSPHFKASVSQAVRVAVAALAPVGYVLWRVLA